MDENEIQIRERLTALESSVKSLHKRVDHIEELVESVQKMTVELQHMRADINKNSEKLDEIEKRPRKALGNDNNRCSLGVGRRLRRLSD